MTIQDIIERAIELIGRLGFVLPIAIFALANLFSRNKKQAETPQTQRSRQPSTQSPTPQAPTARPTMQPMPSFGSGPVIRSQPLPPSAPPVTSAPPAPAPNRPARPGRSVATSNWGSTFADNDAEKRDHALQWGSAFDDNDAEKRDHGLQWGSAFDHERGRTKWGWDESEWGGGFAPKKDAEPRITIG